MIYVPQLKRYLLITVHTYNVKRLVNFVFHEHDTSRAMTVTMMSSSRNVQYQNHENIDNVQCRNREPGCLYSRSPHFWTVADIAFRFELLVPFTYHINIIKTV